MTSKFRKILKNDHRIFHLLIPCGIRERLLGIKRFAWTSDHFALLYRSPCLLHSFGMQTHLQLIELSENFEARPYVHILEPNTIALCSAKSGWVAELPLCADLSLLENSLEHEQGGLKKSCNKSKISTFRFKNMRCLILYLLMIFAFILGSTLALAAERPTQFKIQVGESKEVDLKHPPKNIDISQSDVIDVQRVGTSNRILITALRAGSSSLIVHFPDGSSRGWTFQVGASALMPSAAASLSSTSLLRTARELQRRTGLEVTVDNGRIAFFGTAQNEAQMRAILEICLEREECLPRYTFTEQAGTLLAQTLKAHLGGLGMNEVLLELNLSGVILTGFVSSEEQLMQVMKIAQSVCPRVSSRIHVEAASQTLVQSQLSFYRISQTGLTALGLSTAAPEQPLSETALAKVSTPDLSAKLRGGPNITLSLPEILLKAHSQKGVIQQVAQPAIVVASGGRGEILSGGELLFQSGGQNQKFFSQNYGISVILQPRVVSPNKIVQRVELKITHPQSDPTRNAISSLNSSLLKTEVSSRVNEALLLTRISQKANGKSINKVPILGHLPILGELFKSRELSGEDAELWITLKSDLILPRAPQLERELNASQQSTQADWLD